MNVLKAERNVNTAQYADTLFSLINTSEGSELIKVILQYVGITSPSHSDLKDIDEKTLKDSRLIKKYLSEALNSMIEVTKQNEKLYTTGDLAKYFGVSITSINKWIDAGRFEGVERTEKNKQARISENTLWRSRKGDLVTIKSIVDSYEEEQFTEEEELNSVLNSIKFYEDKYGGSFDEVSKKLQNSGDISDKDKADLREWEYLMSIVK